MLSSLHISNYALISSIDIDFTPGLNIITGETGAGKSIMLGALGLILGNRADTKAIRDVERKTVVEAVFDIKNYSIVNKILAESGADIDINPETCILRREITARGGSRAFINDTPVNLVLLRQVALQLIDIHSQHQNLLLAEPAYQLSIIDSLAGISELKERYTVAYNRYRSALKEYTSLRDMLTRNRAEAEYFTFQLNQLAELKLKPGEQASLEQQCDILSNITDIKVNLQEAIDALSGTGDSVCGAISRASDALGRLNDVYEDSDTLVERLSSARIEINDILDSVTEYQNSLVANPRELADIEERLSAIYSLEARHNVETVEQLIDIQRQLKDKLDKITNGDNTLADLESKARHAKKEAVLLARDISERRHATADKFARELVEAATPLGMKNIKCEIRLNPVKLSHQGMDEIQFMVAFNKNQPLLEIGHTASGGEISRVILAIKSIVSRSMNMPTVIFDEVDTGVSGDIARRMGDEMLHIAGHTQVITITHLPQVAARGAVHFKVYKSDDNDSTTTYIKTLNDDERLGELALMISGDSHNPEALATAARLLDR